MSLVAEGARVTAHSHRHAVKNSSLLHVTADLRDRDEILRAWQLSIHAQGPVTTLILCAGQFFQKGLETTIDDWDELFHTNLRSAVWLCQLLRDQGGKHAIFIVDSFAERGMMKSPVYSGSKTALLGLMKELVRNWAGSARVNAISPGLVGHQSKLPALPGILAGSIQPLDIFEATRFLILNQAINGICLRVDRGANLVESIR